MSEENTAVDNLFEWLELQGVKWSQVDWDEFNDLISEIISETRNEKNNA